MAFLSNESKKNSTFEGTKTIFMSTLDQEGWQKSLTEFNWKMEQKVDIQEIKEKLWNLVMEFGEPILMRFGVKNVAREELHSKVIQIRERRRNIGPRSCKDSSL